MPNEHNVDFSSVEIGHPQGLIALQAAALEATANAVVITDQKGTIIWVNFAFQQLTGYTRAEIVGQNARLLKSGKTPQQVYDELWRTILAGRIWRGELINRRKDGSLYDEEMTITPVQNGTGEATNYIAIKQDITERKKAEEQMWKMEESLRILSHMSDLLQSCLTLEEAWGVIASSAQKLFPGFSGAVFLFSASRNLLETNTFWGRTSSSERGFSPVDCWALRRGRLHHSGRDDVGVRCAHFGTDFHLPSLCIPLVAQGETLGIVCLVAEASESLNAPVSISESNMRLAVSMAEQAALSFANIKLRERLRAQAIRDPLTGLFNRRYLDEYLEREVSNAIRKHRFLGIIMLDVDRFKKFNDMFGHDAGDTVLKELGDYLMKFIRRADVACRYGGDEFTLILPESSLEDTRRRAEELRTSFQQLSIKYRDIVLGEVTLSIGLAAYPEHGTIPSELLEAADSALLRAKEERRRGPR